MDYKETVSYLFNATPVFEHVGAAAYKEGLDNTITLDNHFGNPHKKFKCIHVGGTNGKGSCSHTIAAILQSSGYKVGLYTSPHLVDFRERIKINGICISEDYVIDFVERERGFFEKLKPSFFELTTAMAFKYFAEERVDYAIIEVGLGGRLDCTNIINPVFSIITNISFDHTRFLGDTLAKIAHEKAGIIKDNTPAIIGETTRETKSVFTHIGKQKNAPIIFAEESNEIKSASPQILGGINYTTHQYGEIHCDLSGIYQEKNMNTVLAAIDVLKKNDIITNNESIKEGISNVCELTGLSGRWQCLGTKPTIICDTGHNVGGWVYLSKQIAAQPCSTLRIVFGMVDDKDIDGVMELLPKNAIYYFTRAKSKRSIPENKVMEKGLMHNLKGNCYNNVKMAYQKALGDSSKDDFIFIGGSNYVVADILALLGY